MKAEVILGRIFISIIAIILTFLLIDYVSRWFIVTRSPIERRFPVQCARQPQPYIMFGGKPYGCNNEFNRLGQVGTAPSVPKNPGEFRIIMLGGSTVLNGKPPITGLLEEKFSLNNMSHVKIYNFGVTSFGSGQELALIVFKVSELEPDLIIIYDGGNDILHPFRYDPRPGYPFNYISYENNPLLESDLKDYPAIAMFAYGSNILRKYFSSYFRSKFIPLDETRNEAGWMTENWKDEIASIYITNLIKSEKIARSFDSRFIAFFQPLVYYKSILSNSEKRFVEDDETKKHILDIRRKVLSKIEEAHSANIVDLSAVYQDVSNEVFVDPIHTNQTGKNTIAEEMFKHIIDMNLF